MLVGRSAFERRAASTPASTTRSRTSTSACGSARPAARSTTATRPRHPPGVGLAGARRALRAQRRALPRALARSRPPRRPRRLCRGRPARGRVRGLLPAAAHGLAAAGVGRPGREEEVERLLEAYARQVSDLLAEVVPAHRRRRRPPAPAVASFPRSRRGRGRATPISSVASSCARRPGSRPRCGGSRSAWTREEAEGAVERDGRSPPTRRLGYRRLVERVRAAVARRSPAAPRSSSSAGATATLVELEDRAGRPLPPGPGGATSATTPATARRRSTSSSTCARGGAEYLVLPATSYWWLEHYGGFAEHLREPIPGHRADACTVFRLARRVDAPSRGRWRDERHGQRPPRSGEYAELVARVQARRSSLNCPPGPRCSSSARATRRCWSCPASSPRTSPRTASGGYAGHHPRDGATRDRRARGRCAAAAPNTW